MWKSKRMERNQECVGIMCFVEMMGNKREEGGREEEMEEEREGQGGREGPVFASDHASFLESIYFVLFFSRRTVKTQYLM